MGTYSIIYLRKSETAKEVNELLKEKYNLTYENYNGVDYGIFFTQEMFDEDLRFMNEDKDGKKTFHILNALFPKKPIILCYSAEAIVLEILEHSVPKFPVFPKKM